jgi:hypothetical protein
MRVRVSRRGLKVIIGARLLVWGDISDEIFRGDVDVGLGLFFFVGLVSKQTVFHHLNFVVIALLDHFVSLFHLNIIGDKLNLISFQFRCDQVNLREFSLAGIEELVTFTFFALQIPMISVFVLQLILPLFILLICSFYPIFKSLNILYLFSLLLYHPLLLLR